MIEIGLSTWSDHPGLGLKDKATLSEYASQYPIVEVDSPYYAMPKLSDIVNWQHQVPSDFQFILKATGKMTLHGLDNQEPYLNNDRRLEFTNYRRIIDPLIRNQQLAAILFQFPARFNCRIENIRYLLEIRQLLKKVPIAIEFRNHQWVSDTVGQDSMAYLKKLGFINVSVDEPFDGVVGMPQNLTITNSKLTILRLHGRNHDAWLHASQFSKKDRTSYSYSDEELQQIAKTVQAMAKKTKKVVVIFNNNGNHDAYPNAQKLKEILGLHFTGLNPMQLDLF